jgi:hypothetical protein
MVSNASEKDDRNSTPVNDYLFIDALEPRLYSITSFLNEHGVAQATFACVLRTHGRSSLIEGLLRDAHSQDWP